MSFLGSIGRTIERAVSSPVVQTLFPVAAIGHALAIKAPSIIGAGTNAIVNRINNYGSESQSTAPHPQAPGVYYAEQPGYNLYGYGPGSYQISGSYLSDSYYGGGSWDYSTLSETFSPAIGAPSPGNSSVSWEDRVSSGVQQTLSRWG